MVPLTWGVARVISREYARVMSEIQQTQRSTPPGWYWDTASGLNRWWDGYAWSNAYQPPVMQQPAPVVVVKSGTSHGFHLLMSIITFGLWIPVWIIVTIANA